MNGLVCRRPGRVSSVSRTSAVARTFGPAVSEEYPPVVFAGGGGAVADAYPLVVVVRHNTWHTVGRVRYSSGVCPTVGWIRYSASVCPGHVSLDGVSDRPKDLNDAVFGGQPSLLME